jgi:Domain of unknown function (DUF4389)
MPAKTHVIPSDSPLRLGGTLDAPLSPWQWLVKWLLALPHVIVLVFLWIAFAVLSVVALVTIIVTGRYPRAIFDFNVGVMRWSWRVGFYAYSAMATDRYPPFTLADVPDYPAHLDLEYPPWLSRGVTLVKPLLALPHYLVVAVLAGWLRGLLMLVAGVTLLFGRRYPEPVFDLAVGIDRWVYRVMAYACLMTDTYPPFRLDGGGEDPSARGAAPDAISPKPAAGLS